MKTKCILTLFLVVSLTTLTFATDSTSIYGSWKLQSYHIYTNSKGMDTTYFTTGHIDFNSNHTYSTNHLQMCFMEGNNFYCPPNTQGDWDFTSKNVLKLTYADRQLICDGQCPDIMSRHGVYVKALNKGTMILRTEYYNGPRKHRLVIDAYLVRKIE
ncbi:hypothetical protein [Cytophaga hutchinsonii]|jgi:hypothetical protein|uniref:Lipocalin-like domain-containing protein n=1 Tax=Cytophaga hutchinsonii (strain ATCC 33406 / DSM 1761 / CIP 103989 / NBRC 15051 / NCIMB 9469 / D465) TaxID=269798 RepID=A0A6N4SVC9_CYTH3|nr:hypothetical protein [Cytophaga hutchinsonii]ABG60537.1 hypothetical protein CHU_3298 [Cytophaga hutchinsonii ATCC 33406]SFX90540.1 hypothetical protein SAMN04487930_11293 [Cytophaga hutchinsonii ATCC 33406]